MARVTKTQAWTNIQEEVTKLLGSSKVSKTFSSELMAILEAHLAPKNGGGASSNPPKEIDGVMHYYCRFHQRYEPQDNMVMSKDKSKGYCKASISLWNKTNAKIKKLDSQAVEAMANGDFDKAQEIAKQAKEFKDSLNDPKFYDYDRDWANFNGTNEEPLKPNKPTK